ncbi:MAG: hypothetical protein ACLFM9_04275 [Candidatus Aenigmatarchaeota archaeon]
MSPKGINQVDFAVAASVLIILFVLTVTYVSDYYSAPMQTVESAELRSKTLKLWDTAFSHKGVPPTWHWKGNTTRPSMGGKLWRVPIYLKEYNGTGDTYTLRVPVEAGETYGVPNAYSDSVIAYDDGKALPTDVTGNGFLQEFEVLFEVEIGDYEEKVVDVYYSQNNKTVEVDHADLTESDNTTVNITVFSERQKKAVSGYKVNLTQEKSAEDLEEKYDLDGGFNTSLQTSDVDFSWGSSIPKDIDLEYYSKKTFYQNGTGHVETIEPEVWVW